MSEFLKSEYDKKLELLECVNSSHINCIFIVATISVEGPMESNFFSVYFISRYLFKFKCNLIVAIGCAYFVCIPKVRIADFSTFVIKCNEDLASAQVTFSFW